MNVRKLLFPDKCPFCGKIIHSHTLGCCEDCRGKDIFYENTGSDELSVLPHILNLYCLLHYEGLVKDSLIRYKFQGENWLANPFAALLHQYIAKDNGYHFCAWITSVPVSSSRFKVRGYNQSEIIARKLSALSGIPYADFLARKDTKVHAQTGKMSRTERYQVKRFELLPSHNSIQGGVLLVDDILTTGSTLNECSELLLNAGASFVNAAVLASGRKDLGGVCA